MKFGLSGAEALAALILWLMTSPVTSAPFARPANASGTFGLYPAMDFRVVAGACTDCPTIRQALWYFDAETIAVPKSGLPVAAFATGVRTFDDVRAWASQFHDPTAPIQYPPLVWIAAPLIVIHARLSMDGRHLIAHDGWVTVRPVSKIALNRSYFDASSIAFLSQRMVTVRGTCVDHAFVARTFWPEDFRFDGEPPPVRALPPAATPAASLRAWMREEPRGGAQSPFQANTLWRREDASAGWAERPVLALIVNGAQGDDDEAHAGHFAIVTGRVRADGTIGGWLVNNYYPLDTESEKGILPAPVPLDNYLGDLNAGQSWYRPSYLLVAVLRDERAAALVQSALNRVYNQFYRHQLQYYHPTANCTSISMDMLRALGWTIPSRSPSGLLLAWLGFPYLVLRQRSLAKAKVTFDYLCADQTRLLPAAALEEAFSSLLAIARGEPGGDGRLGAMLREDLDALALLRMPQFPSSRAVGDAPAASMAEYRARLPDDPTQMQIVPVPNRPFPPELRDPDLLKRDIRPSDYGVLLWATGFAAGVAWLLWTAWRHLAGS